MLMTLHIILEFTQQEVVSFNPTIDGKFMMCVVPGFVIFTIAGIMSISKDVYLRIMTLDPLKFALVCVTTGGPATQVTWGKGGIHSIPDTVGVKSQKVINYKDAMYINEIVISTYIIAGTYTFYSSNAVTNEVSSTLDVSGMQVAIQ